MAQERRRADPDDAFFARETHELGSLLAVFAGRWRRRCPSGKCRGGGRRQSRERVQHALCVVQLFNLADTGYNHRPWIRGHSLCPDSNMTTRSVAIRGASCMCAPAISGSAVPVTGRSCPMADWSAAGSMTGCSSVIRAVRPRSAAQCAHPSVQRPERAYEPDALAARRPLLSGLAERRDRAVDSVAVSGFRHREAPGNSRKAWNFHPRACPRLRE